MSNSLDRHDRILTPEQREGMEGRKASRNAVEAACYSGGPVLSREEERRRTSIDALAADYPQIANLRRAALAEADNLEFRAESLASLHALTARLLWESAERLRKACEGGGTTQPWDKLFDALEGDPTENEIVADIEAELKRSGVDVDRVKRSVLESVRKMRERFGAAASVTEENPPC